MADINSEEDLDPTKQLLRAIREGVDLEECRNVLMAGADHKFCYAMRFYSNRLLLSSKLQI